MKPARVKNLDRLADFHQIGCNIAIALGYEKKEFLKAYRKKRMNTKRDFIEDTPLAKCIVEWWKYNRNNCLSAFGSPDGGSGNSKGMELMASDFHRKINKWAEDRGIDTTNKYWPGKPSLFGRQLNLMLSNLEEVGIKITSKKTTDGTEYKIKAVK